MGKPHGTAGEVYVVRISDDPRRFEPGSLLLHEDGRTLTVASARKHRDRLLVTFEGISDRGAAAGLRGALFVEASEARTLPADQFWVHELVGLRVELTDGTQVGSVTEVIDNPTQALLKVETGSGDRLVPAVEPIVVSVEPGEGRIVIDPPEGLL